MKNKRGVMGIIIFFVVLFSILIIGWIASLSIAVIDFGSDTITPIMTSLPEEPVNFSKYSVFTFGQLNRVVQALPWLVGVGYVLAIGMSVAFALSFKVSPNPVFIGLYVSFILLLIFFSIILSNAYEDLFVQDNEISERLQEQLILSYMIIYAPHILTLIAFITGIFLFTGREGSGGFGI